MSVNNIEYAGDRRGHEMSCNQGKLNGMTNPPPFFRETSGDVDIVPATL